MLRGDSVPSFKHDRVTPAQIIILGFLLLIFTGAVVALQTSCEKFSYNLQKRNGA